MDGEDWRENWEEEWRLSQNNCTCLFSFTSSEMFFVESRDSSLLF